MNVSKENINKFFEDTKIMFDNKPVIKSNNFIPKSEVPDMIDPSKKLTRSINDKIGSQRTNIVYLNTDCNLRCEYCYEANSRNGLPDQVKITPQDIDDFLLEICDREKGRVSTIVIMGGEPFLNYELIEYIVLKACSLVEKKGSGWGLSIISNGTLFTDKILIKYKELIETAKKYRTLIAQEVSYDGSGHYRRKWPNGTSSKEHVEKGMQKLIEYEIPFKVSYTVHEGNYKNLVKDCIYILEKFPKPYHYRMTVGWAYADLDKLLGNKASYKLKEEFRPYANYLLDLYGVPICGNTCGYCKECDHSTFVGNSYLSPTTGVSYDEKTTSHDFQQW